MIATVATIRQDLASLGASLRERTILVACSVSCWSAKRQDRSAARDIERAKQTSTGTYEARKVLVEKQYLAAVSSAANALRMYVTSSTAPWAQNGARLLPTANLAKFTADVQRLSYQYEQEVTRFCDVTYPVLLADAPRRLGAEFRPEEWPDTGAGIRSKFGWSVEYMPLADAEDIRLDLGEEHIDLIARSYAEQQRQWASAVVRKPIEDLLRVIGNMHAVLSTDGKVYETLTGNVAEVCRIARGFNIADDPEIERLIRDAERLASVPVDSIRGSNRVRRDAAAEAEAMLRRLEGVLG
jgi:hypothetical protein